MEMIIKKLIEDMLFWIAWIIIPLVMEILPAVGGFFLLLKKRLTTKKQVPPTRYPELTLIVPVYNSADTLDACLRSIADSDYPNNRIDIMLVDNKSNDNSFEVFCETQKSLPSLSMQWLKSKQGKSKAINLALFNSRGKYIIHIDSDGILDKLALKNMVLRFENNPQIHAMTGVILTSPDKIENTQAFGLRLLRRCEFAEYGQAFLAGRNYESELDSIYTLSGAFSAFRSSTILKTFLYNPDTVGEDTHITFQIRKLMKKSVYLCENAIFYVDPIDDLNKLYTQRQRWQRGELEVSHAFLKGDMKTKRFFSNFMVRRLIFDHTFAFPRMIWYFALLCLSMMNYPFSLILGSLIIMYVLYTISAFLYYLNIVSYLKSYPELQSYYAKKWYIIPFLPLYNFMCFFIRFAGIINSIKSPATWKTRTLTEEKQAVSDIIQKDFLFFTKAMNKLKSIFNHNEKSVVDGEDDEKKET